jgi:hypothetical protein
MASVIKQIEWLYGQIRCLKKTIEDQNNLGLDEDVVYDSTSQDFVDILNLRAVVVNELEILIVRVEDSSSTLPDTTYMLRTGKGSYGLGGIPFSLANLVLVSLNETGIPNLQQVTDVGTTTTNSMIVQTGGAGTTSAIVAPGNLITLDTVANKSSVLTTDRLTFSNNNFDLNLLPPTLTADRTQTYQDGDGVFAFLGDIPTKTSDLTNDGSDTTHPFMDKFSLVETDSADGGNGGAIIEEYAKELRVYEEELHLIYNAGQDATTLSIAQAFKDSLATLYVPYTGATADVNLGVNYGITSKFFTTEDTGGVGNVHIENAVITLDRGSGSALVRFSNGPNFLVLEAPYITGTTENIRFPHRTGDVALVSNIVETAVDYTAITNDFIAVDTTVATRTITLPLASSSIGIEINISKIDASANDVIIDGNGAELINGELTQTITAQWTNITVVSVGTYWIIK